MDITNSDKPESLYDSIVPQGFIEYAVCDIPHGHEVVRPTLEPVMKQGET
jgi:hypothetical protein